MSILAVETEKSLVSLKFFNMANMRLNKGEASILFNGKIVRVPDSIKLPDDKYRYVVNMDPLMPHLYLAGLIGAGITLFFTGMQVGIWLIICLVIFSAGAFWSPLFIYIMLKLGLRKAGYKGKVKWISNGDILRVIVNKLL